MWRNRSAGRRKHAAKMAKKMSKTQLAAKAKAGAASRKLWRLNGVISQ